MASYGQPSAYQAQPAPVAQPMQQAAAPQYGVNQQAAYASQPAQPTIDPHLQLAFSRLKSNATVAIVMSFRVVLHDAGDPATRQRDPRAAPVCSRPGD